jgi:hypothetical protein
MSYESKLCPECGGIVDYHSYFGAWVCNKCNWKDITPRLERLERYRVADIPKIVYVVFDSRHDRLLRIFKNKENADDYAFEHLSEAEEFELFD